MKLVVTAGAGFIGSSLCDAWVAAGHDVVCADRPDRLPPELTRAADRTYVQYELGQASQLAEHLPGCDAVVHLAHRGLPSSPMDLIAREASDNVGGALDLVEAARRADVGRIVFASSGGTVYGRADHLPLDESVECAPISAYGAAKVSIEGYLRFYAAAFDLSCVSLRMGNAVGPGQFKGAGVGAPAKFLATAATGRPIEIWGDGRTVRDYVHVDDIVTAFRLAVDRDVPSGAYNIGSGVGHSLNEIVDLVREVSGRQVQVSYRPSRDFDVPSVVLDSTRFAQLTGWRPQIGLRDAMAQMWDVLQGSQPG